jgi:hypothetical protein
MHGQAAACKSKGVDKHMQESLPHALTDIANALHACCDVCCLRRLAHNVTHCSSKPSAAGEQQREAALAAAALPAAKRLKTSGQVPTASFCRLGSASGCRVRGYACCCRWYKILLVCCSGVGGGFAGCVCVLVQQVFSTAARQRLLSVQLCLFTNRCFLQGTASDQARCGSLLQLTLVRSDTSSIISSLLVGCRGFELLGLHADVAEQRSSPLSNWHGSLGGSQLHHFAFSAVTCHSICTDR